MVLALNKLERKDLYNSILNFIKHHCGSITFDNLITITETLVFNKILLRYDNIKLGLLLEN
jgi:hypothetical protein